MFVRKNAVAVKLFILLLAAAGLPATIWGQHHRDHDTDVEVINTPNVNVINTPSVNVNQLPAVQLAPGTAVTVSGMPTIQVGNPVQLAPGTAVAVSGTPTVQVGNTAANPVPVHDAATPKRTPFQVGFDITISHGFGGGEASFTVPDGKRLVIEYASASGESLESLQYNLVTRLFPQTPFIHFLPVTQVVDFDTRKEFIAGQAVKLYSDPGSTVELRAGRNGTTGIDTVSFIISGYLEDVQ